MNATHAKKPSNLNQSQAAVAAAGAQAVRDEVRQPRQQPGKEAVDRPTPRQLHELPPLAAAELSHPHPAAAKHTRSSFGRIVIWQRFRSSEIDFPPESVGLAAPAAPAANQFERPLPRLDLGVPGCHGWQARTVPTRFPGAGLPSKTLQRPAMLCRSLSLLALALLFAFGYATGDRVCACCGVAAP